MPPAKVSRFFLTIILINDRLYQSFLREKVK